VNTLKIDKSGYEDKAMDQMEKVEALAGEIEQQKQTVAEQQKIVAGAEAEVAEAREEVGERLDEVTAQRQAAAAEVPGEAMGLFERLAAQYDGEALAVVTEESRRHMEYACGGCYMGLPVERLNALMVGRGGVVQCPSCGRILFLEEELRASIVK
jgi:predicted  nucleic acid-binding Zn-ribbon protein